MPPEWTTITYRPWRRGRPPLIVSATVRDVPSNPETLTPVIATGL